MRRRYAGLLGAMQRAAATKGPLQAALRHFLKVTKSYWPGLFHCYDHAELPRTNNDLEHLFGSYRYHERRSSGRKCASSATVLRGAVRILAATATRIRPVAGRDLAPAAPAAWMSLRRELDRRRHTRTLGRRFRRRPERYLRGLERLLLGKSTLPA
jgi:hypothetical protein